MNIKITGIILVTPILLISGVLNSYASDKVGSYTIEDMYQMASYYIDVSRGKKLSNTNDYIKAGEFRGYVASMLDNSNYLLAPDNYLDECKKNNSVNAVALRTATAINEVPLDRSKSKDSASAALASLTIACMHLSR